jgi:hypothetical protein
MTYTAKERICLNTARDAIVPCDSPAAHFVLASPGQTVSDEDCEKYGLKEDKSKAQAQDEEPEEKAVKAAPENKAVASPVPGEGRVVLGGVQASAAANEVIAKDAEELGRAPKGKK